MVSTRIGESIRGLRGIERRPLRQTKTCSPMWCGMCVVSSFIFVEDDGKEKTVQVPQGVTVLEAAHSNDVPLEGKPKPVTEVPM